MYKSILITAAILLTSCKTVTVVTGTQDGKPCQTETWKGRKIVKTTYLCDTITPINHLSNL